MDRLFAISDIHGCFKTFYKLIVDTLKLRKSDQLILLGDYIDRGEQSKEVIDFIIDLRDKGFNVIPLRGNHEVMLLDSYNDPAMMPLWLMNHGSATLNSFGISDIRGIDNKYLDFFLKLEYYKILGELIFVHAGFNDTLDDPFSDYETMVWECRYSYQNVILADRIIVHGHRPKTISFVQKCLEEKSKVISIDTGCVYGTESGYGYLSALELNSMKLTSIPNLYHFSGNY